MLSELVIGSSKKYNFIAVSADFYFQNHIEELRWKWLHDKKVKSAYQ